MTEGQGKSSIAPLFQSGAIIRKYDNSKSVYFLWLLSISIYCLFHITTFTWPPYDKPNLEQSFHSTCNYQTRLVLDLIFMLMVLVFYVSFNII